jgi:ubiquinone/menaquinone biosynthesis C-methylase UbiE
VIVINMKYSNLSFYDSIAPQYDSLLTATDHQARLQVEKIFCQYVTGSSIMDFGGGTGLDLGWTAGKFSNVIFVEPSPNMRQVAVQRAAAHPNVLIVENTCDFSQWSDTNLPSEDTVDGILANFAVFNCIENLTPLFNKLTLVARAGSYLVATVIDPRPARIARQYTLLAMLRIIMSPRIVINSNFMDGHRQTFIHALRVFRRSCRPHFILRECIPLKDANFCVLIFEKA